MDGLPEEEEGERRKSRREYRPCVDEDDDAVFIFKPHETTNI